MPAAIICGSALINALIKAIVIWIAAFINNGRIEIMPPISAINICIPAEINVGKASIIVVSKVVTITVDASTS